MRHESRRGSSGSEEEKEEEESVQRYFLIRGEILIRHRPRG